LLSTATAIQIGKRTQALEAWCTVLRNKYGVIPKFVHVDKDMAEIGMVRTVWPTAKIQLCWWHLRKAVRERLAKGKLSTTPYDSQQAKMEFTFIDTAFQPLGIPDPGDFEGGTKDQVIVEQIDRPNALFIRLPNPSPQCPSSATPTQTITIRQPLMKNLVNHTDMDGAKMDKTMLAADNRLVIRIPANKNQMSTTSNNTPDIDSKRTFCSLEHRDEIIKMMENHLCAHPLIPGYSAPSPAGIRDWAVKQMYKFCEEHDLWEVWAYLWGNWYRRGRWELWARCAATEIPRLKTTMIMESQ